MSFRTRTDFYISSTRNPSTFGFDGRPLYKPFMPAFTIGGPSRIMELAGFSQEQLDVRGAVV